MASSAAAAARPALAVVDLTARGLLAYGTSLVAQDAVAELMRRGAVPSTLLLVQVCKGGRRQWVG